MITYEANLNCDGQNCKTRPVTGATHRIPMIAMTLAKQNAIAFDWVFIDDEHYCPDCAEITKPDKDSDMLAALRESIKKEEARQV